MCIRDRLAKGALLGVVLSFMMGVTTLSLPSMIMLRKAVKPKLLDMCLNGYIKAQEYKNAYDSLEGQILSLIHI